MALPTGLNGLAKLALLASDASYFNRAKERRNGDILS